MARIASHHVVLRMKRKSQVVERDGTTVETVEHIALTSQNLLLVKETRVERDQNNNVKRSYGKWVHGTRVRSRVSPQEFQYKYTLQGWITVKETTQ